MMAYWRHLANTTELQNLCILRPTGVHSPNDKPIGSAVLAQVMAEGAYTLQWAPLSPELPLSMKRSGPPSNAWCFGPMRAHNPNGTSIGSAVFAQMTAERPYTLHWFARFPLKIALSHGGSRPHAIHGSLGPPESWTQTATRSFQPFCAVH